MKEVARQVETLVGARPVIMPHYLPRLYSEDFVFLHTVLVMYVFILCVEGSHVPLSA